MFAILRDAYGKWFATPPPGSLVAKPAQCFCRSQQKLVRRVREMFPRCYVGRHAAQWKGALRVRLGYEGVRGWGRLAIERADIVLTLAEFFDMLYLFITFGAAPGSLESHLLGGAWRFSAGHATFAREIEGDVMCTNACCISQVTRGTCDQYLLESSGEEECVANKRTGHLRLPSKHRIA